MKKLLILISLTLSVVSNLRANELLKADYLFKNKEYVEALEIYENLVKQFPTEADILYNAGTTALRLDKHPQSMLYLSRALKYEPNMKDASVNLKILENKMGAEYMAEKDIIWVRYWKQFTSLLSSNEWLIVFIYFSFVLLVTYYLRDRLSASQNRGYPIILITLAIISLLASWSIYRNAKDNQSIVVMSLTPTLFADSDGTEALNLKIVGGQKAKIVNQNSKMAEILLPSGEVAFISSTDVERI